MGCHTEEAGVPWGATTQSRGAMECHTERGPTGSHSARAHPRAARTSGSHGASAPRKRNAALESSGSCKSYLLPRGQPTA